ncbi:DNA polymerase IV [Empedobacter tilapiae]|uniref:DNA polymerase IV n=1 Tax=Empedobacter tilapiae TaxID=2491114 RepID=A0A4Z1BJQ7_9FLAO|nr:DNA polymerase IV [Empedobacter tilapiae]TGN29871.1 DNA polymerase IV [Empedobacter tilapiae]
MQRKIIHIDMDAFFASVEQRDFPELRGKCIAVGGSEERGVIATASYEARKFGVGSAMSSVIAKRKCPQLIFVKPRFQVYKEVSNQIREIFLEYTNLVEPLSLDEAFLDVTNNHKNIEIATDIANEIKQKIKERTNLTASAGVSFNKFLAKIASDYNKPDGLYVITPKMAENFIDKLPIKKFHGIGKVTAERMQMMGIYTGSDLKKLDLEKLLREFGKSGQYYYNIVRGLDFREVNPSRLRKSSGSETTFNKDLVTLEEMQIALFPLMEDVWNWSLKTNIYGRTITVKIKYNDFSVTTKSKSASFPIKNRDLFDQICYDLLTEGYSSHKPVRLLGISISNLENNHKKIGIQLEIPFTEII